MDQEKCDTIFKDIITLEQIVIYGQQYLKSR